MQSFLELYQQRLIKKNEIVPIFPFLLFAIKTRAKIPLNYLNAPSSLSSNPVEDNSRPPGIHLNHPYRHVVLTCLFPLLLLAQFLQRNPNRRRTPMLSCSPRVYNNNTCVCVSVVAPPTSSHSGCVCAP